MPTIYPKEHVLIMSIAKEEYQRLINNLHLPLDLQKITKDILLSSKAITNLEKVVFADEICAGLKETLETKPDSDDVNAAVKTLTASYVNLICEIVSHTMQDIDAIKREFFGINLPNTQLILKEVDVRNSDPHKNGKRLSFLTFETKEQGGWLSFTSWQKSRYPQNLRLVYKPANLNVDNFLAGTTDQSFFRLPAIEMALRDAGHPKLPIYKIMPMGSYGYMQFLANQPQDYHLNTQQEVDEFSYLFGLNAAVCLMLGIDDRHTENIFVSRKMPYLIDLETSFSPAVNKLHHTVMLDHDVGALRPDFEVCKGKSTNSVATDADGYIRSPDKLKFIDGFQKGLELIAQYGTRFISNLRAQDPRILVMRYIPFETQDLKKFLTGFHMDMQRFSGESLVQELRISSRT